MQRRLQVLTWVTSGLLVAVSLACALPADNGDPDAPQWGIDPVETVEPWTPSEQWLELYERDRAIQDLRAAGEMDEYHRQRQELEDWIIQNPDADIPCETLWRYGPPEMRDARCDEPSLLP